jgi:hypothetical protein
VRFNISRKSIVQHVKDACDHFGVTFRLSSADDGAQRYVVNGVPYSPRAAADLLIVGGFNAAFGSESVTFVETSPFGEVREAEEVHDFAPGDLVRAKNGGSPGALFPQEKPFVYQVEETRGDHLKGIRIWQCGRIDPASGEIEFISLTTIGSLWAYASDFVPVPPVE